MLLRGSAASNDASAIFNFQRLCVYSHELLAEYVHECAKAFLQHDFGNEAVTTCLHCVESIAPKRRAWRIWLVAYAMVSRCLTISCACANIYTGYSSKSCKYLLLSERLLNWWRCLLVIMLFQGVICGRGVAILLMTLTNCALLVHAMPSIGVYLFRFACIYINITFSCLDYLRLSLDLLHNCGADSFW